MPGRSTHRAPLRRRVFAPRAAEVAVRGGRAGARRQTLLTPAKGYRLRLLRLRLLQPASDGRHLGEIYFGTGRSLTTDRSKAVAVLAVPDGGSASTRSFEPGQGPRGLRGEPLSLRWRGRPPTGPHQALIEYYEES